MASATKGFRSVERSLDFLSSSIMLQRYSDDTGGIDTQPVCVRCELRAALPGKALGLGPPSAPSHILTPMSCNHFELIRAAEINVDRHQHGDSVLCPSISRVLPDDGVVLPILCSHRHTTVGGCEPEFTFTLLPPRTATQFGRARS